MSGIGMIPIAGLLVACALAPAALADDAAVSWTTFMHAAPSEAAEVIDEVQHGTVVQVLNCAGEWCEVVAGRGIGYVHANILASTNAKLLPRQPGSDCFVAGQTAYHGLYPQQFCHVPNG